MSRTTLGMQVSFGGDVRVQPWLLCRQRKAPGVEACGYVMRSGSVHVPSWSMGWQRKATGAQAHSLTMQRHSARMV